MTTGSITIDKAIDGNPKIDVGECWKDSDGYWLVLAPGYRCGMSDTHTIHEWNVKDVLQAVRGIEDCSCTECSKDKVE